MTPRRRYTARLHDQGFTAQDKTKNKYFSTFVWAKTIKICAKVAKNGFSTVCQSHTYQQEFADLPFLCRGALSKVFT